MSTPAHSSYYDGVAACDDGSPDCFYTTGAGDTSICARSYPFACGDTNGYITIPSQESDGVLWKGWSGDDSWPTKGPPGLNYRSFVTPATDATNFPKYLYTQASWSAKEFPATDGRSDVSINDACRAEFGPEFSNTGPGGSYDCNDDNIKKNDFDWSGNGGGYKWPSGDKDDVMRAADGNCHIVGNQSDRGSNSTGVTSGDKKRTIVCRWNEAMGMNPDNADPTGCCIDGQPWTTPEFQASNPGMLNATWLRCPSKDSAAGCPATASVIPEPADCPACVPYITAYIANNNDPRRPGTSVFADARVRQWVSNRCTAELAALDPNALPAGSPYTSDEVAAAQQWCINAGIAMSQYCFTTDGSTPCSNISSVNADAFFNQWCGGVQGEQDYSTPSVCAVGTSTDPSGGAYGKPPCVCSCINSPMMPGMTSTQSVCYDTNCSAGGYIPSSQINKQCPASNSCTQNWVNVGNANDSLNNQMQQTCASQDSDDPSTPSDPSDPSDDTDDTDDSSSTPWGAIALILIFVLVIVGALIVMWVKKRSGAGRAPKSAVTPIQISL